MDFEMTTNRTLLSMMQDRDFDEALARELLDAVPDVDMLIIDELGGRTTYLNEAVDANNSSAFTANFKCC